MADFGPSIWQYVQPLLERRVLVVRVTLGVTLAATVFAFIAPARYDSTAVVLPDTKIQTLDPSRLTNIASALGFSLPGQLVVSDLYPELLTSDSLLGVLVQTPFPATVDGARTLLELYEVRGTDSLKRYADLVEGLRKTVLSSEVSSTTHVLRLTATTNDPLLSAWIVNTLLARLDTFLINQSRISATEESTWIMRRLTEVGEELATAEEALRAFRQGNRQVTGSPLLQLEEGRLLRKVDLLATVTTELQRQLEIRKIQEAKTVPVLSVLDWAKPAAYRSFPRRKLIVGLAFFAGLTLGIAGAYAATYWTRQQQDPTVERALAELRAATKLRQYFTRSDRAS